MENTKDLNQRLQSDINVNRLVTKADLEKFKQELLFSLVQALNRKSATQNKKWIKTYELKKLLNISTGTAHTLRSNGTLPFTKIGNIVYYSMEDIEKVFNDKKRHYFKEVLPPKK